LTPGSLIDGRFFLEEKAGAGGMGTVFRAMDRREGSVVALKILHGRDEVDVERFMREAAILAELDHPSIVRYVAHGLTTDGDHYLAMEWIEGEDLAVRLGRAPLSDAETLTVLRQAAVAVGFAHASGAVHRDLKPSNLFLRGADVSRLAVVDFGIAGLTGDTQRLTQTGVLLGTPGYASPEQVQGPPRLDPRSDIFSLGCVLYECLAGRPAFEGQNPMAVLAKLLLQEAPRVRDVRPDIAEPIDALVSRMLAKNPAHRPQTLDEVASAIDTIAATCPLRAVASPVQVTLASAEPRSREVPSSDRSRSLTRQEQRLVTVVLAGRPEAEGGGVAQRRGQELPLLRPSLAAELGAAVEPHGGHLTALAGGSLIITVWTPGTAVDRAERAALCALAVRERFADLPIVVVTGRGQVAARVVEGDVIDRGVRSLDGAPAGVVRIDEATAGVLDARFEIARDGAAFVLEGVNEAREAVPLLLGKPAPCVGRNRELAMLEGIFSGCVAEPVASAVLVTGPAGAGKSRLRRELVDDLRRRGDPIEVLHGCADALAFGTPLGAIADLVRDAAGIRGGEPLAVRQQKLTARIGRRIEGPMLARVASFLGEIVSTPFPDGSDAVLIAARANPILMGDAMRAAWEEWLIAECAAQPVLVILEDMQWGDAATARLVDSTLRNLRELPLMVVALARPEAQAEVLATWSKRDVPVIKLGPLPARASEKLVREALGGAAGDDAVRRLVEQSGGNPFYLGELIRAVAAGRGHVLPDSVLGIVEARLDAEGADAKRVLRAASVFGDRFTAEGVAALLGERDAEGGARRVLSALSARELVAPGGAVGTAGASDFVFCHALVREAAYAMLTEADRALGHRLAGDWLERTGHTDAMAMAEHFRRGGEPARAVRWYRRAAEQALDANDLAAALERAGRGVSSGAAWEELGALRLVEAEAHVWRGDLEAAEGRGMDAVSLLEPGTAAWFRAIEHAVSAAAKLGGFSRVEGWAEAAAQAEPAPGARRAQIVCLSECANQLTFGGLYAAADAVILAIDRAAIADPPAASALAGAQIALTRGIRASYDGDLGACREHFVAALAAFEEARDQRNAAMLRSNLGFVLAELGDFAGAEEALRAAHAHAERMSLSDLAAVALHNLGHVVAVRGDLDEARRIEHAAAEAFGRLGDPRMEGVTRAYLARIAILSGDFALAEREARAATALLLVAPPLRAGAGAVLARALLGLGRDEEALLAARDAFATLTALGALEEGETLVRLVYAEALARAGAKDELRAVIFDARERLLARAAKISDPSWRERFLQGVPDNARTLELARAVQGDV
jgi:eukaryotic-like serine/threonine-protein kinase